MGTKFNDRDGLMSEYGGFLRGAVQAEGLMRPVKGACLEAACEGAYRDKPKKLANEQGPDRQRTTRNCDHTLQEVHGVSAANDDCSRVKVYPVESGSTFHRI